MSNFIVAQPPQNNNRTPQSYSVVLQFYNRCNELITGVILDSTTRSGATRKGNGYLKQTFFVPVKKVQLSNYCYWTCRDIADLPGGEA